MQSQFKTILASPATAGEWAHCRRTAAVADLIAHQLFLPSEEKDLLRAACLSHHRGTGVLARKSVERLLADIFEDSVPAVVLEGGTPDQVRGVLSAYDTPGRGTALESRLADILRLADAFDQNMEAQPIDCEGVSEILDRLQDGADAGLWTQESINALVQATVPPPMGEPESWRVPVFPQAALRALNLMRNPRSNLTGVVEAAKLDPAIAGLIMRLANSALFGSRTPVSTLSKAIVRLGFVTAQKVVTSAALRPLFGSPRLQEVWQHSLLVADLSEQLARQAGQTDPAEAYLAGLLHDVGRIALLSLPVYDSSRLRGLEERNCSTVYAENLLLRTDHAGLGAQIAALWRLPEPMVSAIRQHHRPEAAEGPLTYLLYVAEFLSESEEDMPSVIRLETCLKGIGLTADEAGDCRVSALGNWLAAAA
jgi:putative nucleotidyltransferase with HDIG domain